MSQKKIVDVYERTDFATKLIDIATKRVKSPFCIGLDAKWGNGKTTFVKEFLIPAANSQELPVVVFDCFEQERSGDPFLSITQHILQSLPSDKSESTTEIRKDLIFAAKKVAVSGGKVLLKAIVKTVLKQDLKEIVDEIASGEQSEIVADETSSAIEAYVTDKLENGLKDKLARENFKDAVYELAKKTSKHERILVVIDELDRCRPQFALDVLESVKHILNAKGLIFVFSYHKEQLYSSIKHEFGLNIDAEQYLHKFINLDLILPSTQVIESHVHFKHLTRQYFDEFEVEQRSIDSFVDILFALNKHYEFEARTVEKICTTFALSNEHRVDIRLQTLLIVWSIKNPSIFADIFARRATSSDASIKLKINQIAPDLKMDQSIRQQAPTLQEYVTAILVGPNRQNFDEWSDISYLANQINQYK